MKNVLFLHPRLACLALALFIFGCYTVATADPGHAASVTPGNGTQFRLRSDELSEGGKLPEKHVLNGFGRTGENRSPHLRWENAPAGTKSFVVTLYDPDAPTGSGWWHWVIVDIPASARELQSAASGTGRLPRGARETRTDFGQPGYDGAAPPAGQIHRYIFTIHALDVERLEVPDTASAAMIGFLVHTHSLGSAKLQTNYGP